MGKSCVISWKKTIKWKKSSGALDQEHHVQTEFFCLKRVIEKRFARHLETQLTFVDLQKAYDAVSVSRLWNVLEQSNINHNYIMTLTELYKDSKSRIKIGNQLIDILIMNKELSLPRFKIYIALALANWKREIYGV